jgi:hypothetical protein
MKKEVVREGLKRVGECGVGGDGGRSAHVWR